MILTFICCLYCTLCLFKNIFANASYMHFNFFFFFFFILEFKFYLIQLFFYDWYSVLSRAVGGHHCAHLLKDIHIFPFSVKIIPFLFQRGLLSPTPQRWKNLLSMFSDVSLSVNITATIVHWCHQNIPKMQDPIVAHLFPLYNQWLCSHMLGNVNSCNIKSHMSFPSLYPTIIEI